MSLKRKILLVEDEEKLAGITALYLQNNGYDVKCVNNGSDVLPSLSRENFDLVLLDLMLPEISGEQLLPLIKNKYALPIIVLSARSQIDSIVDLLSMGADDYMVKPYALKELVARVERRLPRVGPSIFVVDENRLSISKEGHALDLTKTEYEIFKVLLESPNRVFTREQLLEIALGNEFKGYDRTLDVHIRNIRKKIGDDGKEPRWIKTSFKIGYYYET